MDYQYINTIKDESYIDLPSKFPFPSATMGDIHKYGCCDHFLKSNLPGLVIYFKLCYDRKPPIEVLSKVARKEHSVSVGRFTQCVGWAWNGDLLLNNFDDIVDTAFYTEDEIDAFAQSGEAVPKREERAVNPVQEIKLDVQAIKAVFFAAMLRWLRGDMAVQIAVPGNVDYNAYVAAAVKKIYSYFPVGLRAEAGFCSYLPRDKANELRPVFIGFVPESMADGKTVFLDGSSVAAIEALTAGTGLKNLDLFINYVCSLEDEERARFLHTVYVDMENSGAPEAANDLAAIKYSYLGDAIWLVSSNGAPHELIRQWMQFYSNRSKYPLSMSDEIDARIRELLTDEVVAESIRADCENETSADGIGEVMITYNALCGAKKSWSDIAWSTMCSALRTKLGLGYREIYDFARSCRAKLSNIVDEEKITSIAVSFLREKYNEINGYELETSAQIEAAAREAKKLLDASEKLYETQDALAFAAQVHELVQRIEDKRYSNDVIYREINEKLAGAGSYFEALNIYADSAPSVASMDSAQIDGLKQTLAGLRPGNITDYIKAFKAYYNIDIKKKPVLADVAALPEFVSSIILTDLSSFRVVQVTLSSERKAREINDYVVDTEGLAARLSHDCRINVRFNNKEVSAGWLKALAGCTLTAKNVGDKAEFRRSLFSLIEKGGYRVRDIPAICAMTEACGVDAVEDIFCFALEGRFTNSSDKDYFTAFDCLRRNIGMQDDAETLETLIKYRKDMRTVDPVAGKAFSSYVNECKRAQKNGKQQGSPAILIAVGAVAMCLLVLSTVLFIRFRHLNARSIELDAQNKQQIEMLEKEVHDNYAVNLFDREFDDYAQRFSDIIAKEENQSIVNDYSTRHKIDDEISKVGDQQVKWGEYVFWTFVLAADENNIVTPESIEAVQLRVNSAIELMHPDLTVPAVPESTESPEELTDGENEMPSDDTTERAIDNNSYDDPAAVTEPEPSSEITHEAVAGETAGTAENEAVVSAADVIGESAPSENAESAELPSGETSDQAVEPTPEAAEEIDLVDQIIEMMRHIFEAAKKHFDLAVYHI